MTELQAALGVSQMKRLDDFVATRHQLQQRYDELLKGLPVITPYQDKDSYSALHLYPIHALAATSSGNNTDFHDNTLLITSTT
jgi:dTDP-4-amino-4,6-dideoxygalactose transaminase